MELWRGSRAGGRAPAAARVKMASALLPRLALPAYNARGGGGGGGAARAPGGGAPVRAGPFSRAWRQHLHGSKGPVRWCPARSGGDKLHWPPPPPPRTPPCLGHPRCAPCPPVPQCGPPHCSAPSSPPRDCPTPKCSGRRWTKSRWEGAAPLRARANGLLRLWLPGA